MSWAQIAAVPLENEHVLLRPVRPEDREQLRAMAMNPEIWRYFPIRIATDADFDAFFDSGLNDLQAGIRVAYTISDRPSGQAAGSMSVGNMAEKDGRLEIGWSWLGRDWQGKGINRWAKFLMMRHAFEQMGAERVEFKTDRLNVQARHGLLNIGAREEGILRSFNPMPDGRRRDAVFFSVLRAEWPHVREQLLSRPKVARAGTGTAGAGPAGAGPADGAPADGVPADGAPADGVPADGAPADGAPADGAPAGGVPAEAGR
jgi:RimJ/RimL family protein N-acetyltransferase